jgi:hypothetical protein
MKHVAYLGETVLTSDEVGAAVLDYARALVNEHTADVVDIPVLVDHIQTTASMILGPGSPLMVFEVEDQNEPMEDASAIADLKAKRAALGPHRARPSEPFAADAAAITFDYL